MQSKMTKEEHAAMAERVKKYEADGFAIYHELQQIYGKHMVEQKLGTFFGYHAAFREFLDKQYHAEHGGSPYRQI